MLTQLTTLLGLTPTAAPTEAKLPEGGDADFAEVFAQVEANGDPRPKTDEKLGELVADTDEVAEDSADQDELTDGTQELIDDVEPIELSKSELKSQEDLEDFRFLEQDSVDAQRPKIVSADAPALDKKPWQDSPANATWTSVLEPRLARTQMHLDFSQNSASSGLLPSQAIPRNSEFRFPRESPPKPEAGIQEPSLPSRIRAELSPMPTSNGHPEIQKTLEKETTLVSAHPLGAEPSLDAKVNRLERSVANQAAAIQFDKTDAPKDSSAMRSKRLHSPILAPEPSIKAQDRVHIGSPAREGMAIDLVSASRSVFTPSNNASAMHADVYVEHAQENQEPVIQEEASEIATKIPRPTMPPVGEQLLTMPRKPHQLFEQEQFPALTPNKESRALLPNSPPGNAQFSEQTQDVKNTLNPRISAEKRPPEPSELGSGTDAPTQKSREIASRSDTAVTKSAMSVEKAAEMPVFIGQIQPRPEPTATPKPTNLSASRMQDDVKLSAAAPLSQQGEVRIHARESRESTIVTPKPENWSERPVRELHVPEQPLAIKAKTLEQILVDPQNKMSQPAPSIQASSVNYPFLVVSDDEKETLEVALQAPSGDLRSQLSTAVMPAQNSPIRPDPALVMRQVSEAIQKLSEAGGVELRLSPEELGSVRMQFIQGESGLTVHINAERPETLDLIRRHIDQLAKDLAESGFDTTGFSFGDENTNNQQKAGSASLDANAEEPVPTEHLAAQGLDGLDIRV